MDARLIARFNADLHTPCHAQCNSSQSRHFGFFIIGSSRLQPAGLTCIESHCCLLFPQLGCNSATGPTAVSAGSISCGIVDATLIARFNADLHTSCHAHCNMSQSQHFDCIQKRFITCQSTVASTYMNQSALLPPSLAASRPLSLPTTSSADMWMQGSSLASTQACIHPAKPVAAWHRHKMFMFPTLITSASRTGSKLFLSARCFVQTSF